jgi:hypothetical protein
VPASDSDLSSVPEGLPAGLASAWSTAITSLTDRELSAVVLRFGFRTGKPESFAVIGRELGANRIRAQAIFRNAIQRLGAQDETRGSSREARLWVAESRAGWLAIVLLAQRRAQARWISS